MAETRFPRIVTIIAATRPRPALKIANRYTAVRTLSPFRQYSFQSLNGLRLLPSTYSWYAIIFQAAAIMTAVRRVVGRLNLVSFAWSIREEKGKGLGPPEEHVTPAHRWYCIEMIRGHTFRNTSKSLFKSMARNGLA